MFEVTRRQFVALAGSGVVGAPFALSQAPVSTPLRAEEIVARIKAQVGVEWKSETVDTFKAGDPATLVTGIVTTAMATFDVLRKAVSAKANFVVTSEPTFFSRADTTTTDPVVAAKDEFIKKNGLVVWRFSDQPYL